MTAVRMRKPRLHNDNAESRRVIRMPEHSLLNALATASQPSAQVPATTPSLTSTSLRIENRIVRVDSR